MRHGPANQLVPYRTGADSARGGCGYERWQCGNPRAGSPEFRLWRHVLIPGVAALVFLFPLWGIVLPGGYTLVTLLPFVGLGWLCVGGIAAAVLRARHPSMFKRLGHVIPDG